VEIRVHENRFRLPRTRPVSRELMSNVSVYKDAMFAPPELVNWCIHFYTEVTPLFAGDATS